MAREMNATGSQFPSCSCRSTAPKLRLPTASRSSRVAVVSGVLALPSSSAQTWPCSLPCQVLSVLPLWSWVLACCKFRASDGGQRPLQSSVVFFSCSSPDDYVIHEDFDSCLALEQLLNLGMEYFWCTVDPIWKSVEGVSAERRSDCTYLCTLFV